MQAWTVKGDGTPETTLEALSLGLEPRAPPVTPLHTSKGEGTSRHCGLMIRESAQEVLPPHPSTSPGSLAP